MEKLNFEELKKGFIESIEKLGIMVLATASAGKVTARPMSIVNIEEQILFQSDVNFLKFKQIKDNPNVAMTAGNIQIEGIAKIGEHSLASSNSDFVALYKEKHRGSYDSYSGSKNTVVIRVNPTFVTFWNYVDGQPCRDFLDFSAESASREWYKP